MKDTQQQDRQARWVVIGIVVAMFVLLSGIIMYGSKSWRVFPRAKLVPKPLNIQASEATQVAQTDCYGFLLSKDFEISTGTDCSLNAYARPQKYRYINVTPYFDARDDEAVLAKWRGRWLTLQAQETSKEEVSVAGKKAWKITETYPQNTEKFITYVVLLPRPVPVDSQSPITALEIRGWATQPEDIQLLDEVVSSWQWRL